MNFDKCMYQNEDQNNKHKMKTNQKPRSVGNREQGAELCLFVSIVES